LLQRAVVDGGWERVLPKLAAAALRQEAFALMRSIESKSTGSPEPLLHASAALRHRGGSAEPAQSFLAETTFPLLGFTRWVCRQAKHVTGK
jgi:hypothetical protein